MTNRFVVLGCGMLVAMQSGCTATGGFYPIRGPLAPQTPGAAIPAKITEHLPNSVSIAMTLPSGEKVAGSLYITFPTPKKAAPGSTPGPMSSEWDSVFGVGTYVARVVGQGQDARGMLTGDRGTTMRVEVHTNGSVPAEGVATDNVGNLYKVTL